MLGRAKGFCWEECNLNTTSREGSTARWSIHAYCVGTLQENDPAVQGRTGWEWLLTSVIMWGVSGRSKGGHLAFTLYAITHDTLWFIMGLMSVLYNVYKHVTDNTNQIWHFFQSSLWISAILDIFCTQVECGYIIPWIQMHDLTSLPLNSNHKNNSLLAVLEYRWMS